MIQFQENFDEINRLSDQLLAEQNAARPKPELSESDVAMLREELANGNTKLEGIIDTMSDEEWFALMSKVLTS